MNRKTIIFAGICISLLMSSCEKKNNQNTTEKTNSVETTTVEEKTTIKETKTFIPVETESITETENEILSDTIDLDKEKDNIIEYAELFIVDYVDCLKDEQKNREKVFAEIPNENLKKYINYTIDNKSYVDFCNPTEKTNCHFENIDIKKINDMTICFKSSIIFSDEIDYKKSRVAVGDAYVVVSRKEGKNIVEDLFWNSIDTPDVLYRKEHNPYEKYIDFWNNEDEVNLLFDKVSIK